MNESQRLASQYERAINGGAWHGPAWREVLSGVSREVAQARPIAGAHTIAEIVHHAHTWHGVVRQRLLGETPQVSDAEDWPAPEIADEAAWRAARDGSFASADALRESVAAFPPERLHERRPGLEDTWYGLVQGELQHVLYHAGQIALLRKAAGNGA